MRAAPRLRRNTVLDPRDLPNLEAWYDARYASNAVIAQDSFNRVNHAPPPYAWALGGTGGNLLPANQSSVETEITGWTANLNCTVAQSSAQALQGTSSLAVTATAAGTAKAITTTHIPATPGQAYTAHGSFRAATAARNCQVVIQWRRSDGSFITEAVPSSVANTTTGWTQVSVTAAAPADTALMNLGVIVTGSPAAGEVHYVDAVGLYEVSPGKTQTGQPWTVLAGAPSIVDGALLQDTSGTVQTHLVVDLGAGMLDHSAASNFFAPLNSHTGVTVRVVDVNTYVSARYVQSTQKLEIFTSISNTAVIRSTSAAFATPVDVGERLFLECAVQGDVVTASLSAGDQTLTATYTIADASLRTGTRAGLRTTAAYVGSTWDNFVARGPKLIDGQGVSVWPDRSGKGRHAVQSTAAKRPLYRSGGKNILSYAHATASTTTGFVQSNSQLDVSSSPPGGAPHGTTALAISHVNRVANSNFETDAVGWSAVDLALGASARAAMPLAGNIVANPTAATDVTGGAVFATPDGGNTVVRMDTDNAPEGGSYFRVGSPATGTRAYRVLNLPLSGTRPTPGQVTTISFWYRRASGTSTSISVALRDGNGLNATLTGPTVVLDGTWRRYTYTGPMGTAPSGSNVGYLTFSGAATTTELTVDIAAAQVHVGADRPFSPPTSGLPSGTLQAAVGAFANVPSLDAGGTYAVQARIFAPATGVYGVYLPSAPVPATDSGPGRRYQLVKNGPGALVEEATTNLFEAGSLEVSGKWAINNTTLVVWDYDRFFQGTRSFKATVDATLSGVGLYNLPLVPCRANETYTASVYVYVEVATDFRVAIEFPSQGQTNDTGPYVTVPAGKWTRIVRTFTTPNSPAVNGLRMTVYSSTVTAGREMWFDAAQLEKKSYATTFTDGAAGSGYSWIPTTNLVPNPSFEADTVGWQGRHTNLLSANAASVETDTTGWVSSYSQTALTRTTAVPAVSGTAALQLTAGNTGGSPAQAAYAVMQYGAASIVSIIPGEIYTAMVHARSAAVPRQVQLAVYFYDTAGTAIVSSTHVERSINYRSGTTGWTQVPMVFQAPIGATRCALEVTFHGALAGEVHYIDAASVMNTPGMNLAPDPGYDEGGSWSMEGGTGMATGVVSRSTERSYTGESSLKVVATGAGTISVRHATVAGVRVNEGQTFTGSVYVWSPEAFTGIFLFLYRTAAGAFIGSTSSAISVPANAWTRLTHTGVVAAGAETLELRLDRTTATGVDKFHYIDAAQIVPGSAATTYLPNSTTNLVRNSSFEVDTATWTNISNSGGTFARSTTRAYFGTSSGLLTMGTGIYGHANTLVRMELGQTYRLSAWVYPTATTPLELSIRGGLGAARAHIQSSGALVANQWQQVTATFTPTTALVAGTTVFGDVALNIGWEQYGAPPAGSELYIDGVQVEAGTIVTPYVDASSGAPGHSWDASENLIANSDFEVDSSGWEGIGKNLLTVNQSNFETDLTGWYGANNCTLTRSTTVSWSGTASAVMTAVATAASTRAAGTTRIPVVPGQVYTFSLWMRAATTGRQVGLEADYFNAAGAYLSSTAINVPGADNNGGWTQLQTTMSPPQGAATVNFIVRVIDAVAGEAHYIDGATFSHTPSANLVPNPTFDDGVVNWVTVNGSTVAVREGGYLSRRSALVTLPTIAGTSSGIRLFPPPPMAVGLPYTFSAWVYVPTGNPAAVVSIQAGGMPANITGLPTTATNTWQRISATFTPATTTMPAIYILNATASTAGQVFYVDGAQLVQGTTTLPFAAPTSTNLVLNPSAEVDVQNVATPGSSPATFTRTTTEAWAGPGSFSVTTAGTANAEGIQIRTTDAPGVGSYTGSLMVKGTSGVVIQTWIRLYNSSGAVVQEGGSTTVTLNGAWQRLDAPTIPITEAGAGQYLAIMARTAVQVATTFYVDAVEVHAGTTAVPFVGSAELGPGFYANSADNMLSTENASFDGGTVGQWNSDVSGATLTASTERFLNGTHSMRIAHAAGAENVSGAYLAAGPTVVANTTYTFSAWVYVPLGSQAVRLRIPTQSTIIPAPINSASSTVFDAWQRLTLTFTTGSTGGQIQIKVNSTSTTLGTEVAFVDAVQFEQRDHATPYGAVATGQTTSTRRAPTLLGGASLERAYRAAAFSSYFGVGSWVLATEPAWWSVAHGGWGAQTTVAVAPGGTYTFSLMHNPGGNAPQGSQLRVLDTVTGAIHETGLWGGGTAMRRDAVTFTAGPTTTSVILQGFTPGVAITPGNHLRVDAAQLEQRGFPTPFQSTGAAHASTSTRRTAVWVAGGASIEHMNRQSNSNFHGGWAVVLYPRMIDYVGGFPAMQTAAPITVAAGVPYTASVALAAEAGGQARLDVIDANTGALISSSTTTPTSATYQRYATTFTPTTTSVILRIVRVSTSLRPTQFIAGATSGTLPNAYFYVDAVQLEQREHATPFAVGTVAGTDSGLATRTKGHLTFSSPAAASTTTVTMICTGRLVSSGQRAGDRVLLSMGSGGGDILYINVTGNNVVAAKAVGGTFVSCGSGLTALPTTDVPITAALTFDGTTLRGYASINGGPVTTASVATATSPPTPTTVAIGYSVSPVPDAAVENAMIFNTALSSTDIANILTGTTLPSTAANRSDCVFSAFVNDPPISAAGGVTSGATITPAAGNSSSTTGWNLVTARFVRDKNPASHVVVLSPTNGASAPMYVDSVQVERGLAITNYTPPTNNVRALIARHPISPNKLYGFSYAARTSRTAATTGFANLGVFTAGGGALYSVSSAGSPINNTAWTTVATTFASGSTAASADVSPAISGHVLGETTWVDTLQLVDITPTEWSLGGTGGNLITANQSSAETDLTGFSSQSYIGASGSTAPSLARSTDWAADGVASVKVTNMATNADNVRVVAGSTRPAVTAGEALHLRATLNRGTVPLGTPVVLYAEVFTSTGAYNGSPSALSTTITSDVMELVGNVNIPANSTSVHIMVSVGNPASGTRPQGEYYYVDKLAIIRPTLPAWLPPVKAPNGMPLLQFDGVDDALIIGDFPWFDGNNPWTVYVLHQPDAVDTTYRRLLSNHWYLDGARHGTLIYSYLNAAAVERFNSPSAGNVAVDSRQLLPGSTPFPTSSPTTTSIVYTGSTLQAWANGVSSAPAGTATRSMIDNPNFIVISGDPPTGVSGAYLGTFGGLLIFSGAHDAATRSRIERWLAGNFGVTSA